MRAGALGQHVWRSKPLRCDQTWGDVTARAVFRQVEFILS
jgi:hypothetical protein